MKMFFKMALLGSVLLVPFMPAAFAQPPAPYHHHHRRMPPPPPRHHRQIHHNSPGQ